MITIRDAAAQLIVRWANQQFAEHGDRFATVAELARIQAAPLEYTDLLKGVRALDFLQAALMESNTPTDSPLDS